MRATPRDVLQLLGILAALGLGVVGVRASGLRWQHTESLPRGLYRLDRTAPITRGRMVLWCLDARRGRWARTRGYLTRGACPGETEMLGKVVLAVAGDTVDWTPDGVRFRGHLLPRTRPVTSDHAGRHLQPIRFAQYVLPPGFVWLYSPYSERSFDSRYLGPFAIEDARGVVIPLGDRLGLHTPVLRHDASDR